MKTSLSFLASLALWLHALVLPLAAGPGRAQAAPPAPQPLSVQKLPPFSKLQLDGALDLQMLPPQPGPAEAQPSARLEAPAGRVRAWVEGETLHLLAPTATALAAELGLAARPRVVLHQALGVQAIELRGSSQVQIGRLQAPRLRLLLSGSGGLRVEELEAASLDLAVHGSGDLQLGRVQAQRLGISLSGSGGLSVVQLQAEQLEGRLRASGGVSAGGRVQQQDWVLSGSGDLRAPALQGGRVRLRSFGSGDASLGEVEQLDLSVYGSGDVSYAGQPALQLWLPGSGKVSARVVDALAPGAGALAARP